MITRGGGQARAGAARNEGRIAWGNREQVARARSLAKEGRVAFDGGCFAALVLATTFGPLSLHCMSRSIRNQILLPLVTLQVLAIAAIAVTTATLAARRTGGEIIDRLNGVVSSLGDANFPFTSSVLARMRGLSGAHFIAYDNEGQVTATSFPLIADPPPPAKMFPASARLENLGDSPTVSFNGVQYFAASVPSAQQANGRSLLVLYPETNWQQARREAALPSLALGGVILLLMVLVTVWVVDRISRRLRDVQRKVARIASGDFQELPGGDGVDEIDALIRSVNRMCVDLKAMQHTIQRSERMKILAQLAAGMAHTLRNSLTGARLSVQLYAKRHPPSASDESLTVALRQLAMMEEQVRALLALGKLERQPPERVDLVALLSEVALLVRPAAEHAKVLLQWEPPGEPAETMGEVAAIRAAVLNLTLNAIEAAGAQGQVELTSQVDDAAAGGNVGITVSDTGAGPSPELADSLMEPFVTTKEEGVGLGLALAQEVAASHGGRLCWSRENGWTHFRLTLPHTKALA